MSVWSTSTASSGITIDDLRNTMAELSTLGTPNASPLLVEIMYPLVPARKHKRRRIQKKWLCRFGFVHDPTVDKGQVWMIEPSPVIRYATILAYPRTYAKLKYELGGINEHSNTDLRRVAGEDQGRVRRHEPF